MGFFSSLFNSKSKGISQISNSMGVIDREDLACRLIRLRKKMDLISRGESESEAIKKSEVFLNKVNTLMQNMQKSDTYRKIIPGDSFCFYKPHNCFTNLML